MHVLHTRESAVASAAQRLAVHPSTGLGGARHG